MSGPDSELAPGIHELSVVDADDELREYLLFVPRGEVRGFVVLFHPFGSNPELVLQGGTDGGYLCRPLTGASQPAQPLGLAVLVPRSRGRRLDGVSLSWRPHLDATWQLSESLRDRFDLTTIGVGGLSMGGLEALVFAGQHPEGVGAAWAANSIVDLGQWWRDLPHEADASGEPGLAEVIATEVGGTPDEVPDEYLARSPFTYVDGLARVPLRIVWSPSDAVIPHQRNAHSHRLATRLMERGGDVVEVVVTHLPADASWDAGRFAHEACDVREAMGWLAERMAPAPAGAKK
jgi:pimeloyl-ACP methyl ester carboxylesterase